MIWLAILVLAVVVLSPLGAVALGRHLRMRGRREAALALHGAQLTELDRDLAIGRLAPAEHAQARLEVQRRLLAAAESKDLHAARGARAPLLITLAVVPVGALALYLIGGHPGLPAEPLKARIARIEKRQQEEAVLIAELRARLAQLDPHTEQARQGYVLLGNVEASRGDYGGAAKDWQVALNDRFDPTLAAVAAQAETMAAGRVTPNAAALFRRALAAAPKDAPWRPMAEKRLAEAAEQPATK